MKYRVTTASFDTSKMPPEPVKYTGRNVLANSNDLLGVEIIDIEDNVLFSDCEDVWDVEDRVLEFWNRLNEHDKDAPFYTHSAAHKIVVVDVRPVTGAG